jgi:hypothetical protein
MFHNLQMYKSFSDAHHMIFSESSMSDFNDLMRKVYLMEQKLMITLITNIFQFSCVLSSDISPFFFYLFNFLEYYKSRSHFELNWTWIDRFSLLFSFPLPILLYQAKFICLAIKMMLSSLSIEHTRRLINHSTHQEKKCERYTDFFLLYPLCAPFHKARTKERNCVRKLLFLLVHFFFHSMNMSKVNKAIKK